MDTVKAPIISYKATSLDIYSISALLRFITALAIAYYVATAIYNLYFHPLHAVPGPWWYAISGLPRFRMQMTGQTHKVTIDLHRKYGDVVRLAPDEVSFATGRAWHDVAGMTRINDKSAKYAENPKEPIFYRYLSSPKSLIQMGQAEHTHVRRTIAPAFSAHAVTQQEPLVMGHIDRLIELLHKVAASGQTVDISKMFNWATFDIIGDLGFGEAFGCLDSAKDHEWVSVIFDTVRLPGLLVALHRFLGGLVTKLIAGLAISSELRRTQARHRAQSAARVDKRRALGPGRPDFMTPMLELKEDGETALSIDVIRGTSSTIIVAGSETSATLLAAAMYFLTAVAPEWQTKVAAEVRAAFASDSDISFTKVRDLPYLSAVIDESLRLHPPAGTGFPRQARTGGAVVCGYYMPEGTVIGICQWAMHHNPRNFVLSEEFHPERWLGDERFASDHHDAFQPFSYGSRNCIGRHLAIAEIRTILARIAWNFDVRICKDSLHWQAEQRSYILWEKGPLHVELTPRTDLAGQ